MDLDLDTARPGRRTVAGAPAGYDAFVLAHLAARAGPGGLLHIGEDRRRLRELEATLSFFAPEVELLVLPPWDCLPYDRISPSPAITAQRLSALVRLLEPARGPRIVLTSAFGLLRRMPPREALAAALVRVRAGEPLDEDGLEQFLLASGYTPAEALNCPGDFLRQPSNDRVELWPPGAAEPIRLQLSAGKLAAAVVDGVEVEETLIPPMSEIVLDEDAKARFGTAYRRRFGAEAEGDPLAAAVASGRRHAGMEHWLPLFFERTETLLDWCPDAVLGLDPDTEEALDHRLAEVAGAYDGRKSMDAISERVHLPVYHPLPPEEVFLTRDTWLAGASGRSIVVLRPGEPEAGEPDAGGRQGPDLSHDPEALAGHLARMQAEARASVVLADRTGQRAAVVRRLGSRPPVVVRFDPDLPLSLAVLPLRSGFLAPGIAVVAQADVTGRRRERERPAGGLLTPSEVPLRLGDLVVHADHGIGLCDGLEAVTATGAPHACVRLLYRDNDRLFVPVENLDLLWRFGPATERAPLDKLGGSAWPKRLASVAADLVQAAETLVATQAKRECATVEPVAPPASAWRRFVERFPYTETEDQQAAIDAVLDDLRSGRLMDRLIVGDVGYGKTEVALRAAFAVAASGRQVAVVAPTLPLARQHFRDFRSRFAGFGLELVELTGTGKAAHRDARARIKDGRARIAIGTHALLGAGIRFADLGLVVVDEEQRFGVQQKERLKELAERIHVLTMSATPIPRTLQLAFAGLRDLSVIATPPVERQAVATRVGEYDPAGVRDALMREHRRGGQSFYVCPRLADLETVRGRLGELVPDLRIAVAHGKLAPEELDDAVTGFAEGGADILLATNIIESGLNIPTANTLIVHRADMFGLAQLYQLRGRVGRGSARGVCLLTTEPGRTVTPEAARRLATVATLSEPGSGFDLSNQDMDMRGAGNLLGNEQSGHLRDVGAEMFQELLRRGVEAAKANRPVEPPWAPRINLDLPVLVPESYVGDLNERLALYRTIARLESSEAADAFAAELTERHGPPPPEVETLLAVGELKRLCRLAGIEQLDIGPKGALVGFRGERDPKAFLDRHPEARRRPDGRLSVSLGNGRAGTGRLDAVRRLLIELAGPDAGGAGATEQRRAAS